jgi:predicted small secreted protein
MRKKRTLKREMVMKKLLMVLMLLGAVMSLTSCNTMHGAGQDVENAGAAVKKAAN